MHRIWMGEPNAMGSTKEKKKTKKKKREKVKRVLILNQDNNKKNSLQPRALGVKFELAIFLRLRCAVR